MATTWSDLETLARYIRDGNESVFEGESDTLLIGLYKDAAKSDMLEDLMRSLNIDVLDAGGYLDEVVDLHTQSNAKTDILRKALAAKQLWYYYFDNNAGEGTFNYDKMRFYERRYNSYKSRFEMLNNRGTIKITRSRLKLG